MRKLLLPLLLLPLFVGTASADFVGAGTGFAIPDNNPIGASSSINVNLAPNEIVNNVSVVLVDFNHTWIGDLTATLTGPSGSIDLFFRTGAASAGSVGDPADVNGFYVFSDPGASWWFASSLAGSGTILQGVYAPSTQFNGFQSFATEFAGTTANGNWTLTISDNASGDIGGIGEWILSIRSTPIPEPTSVCLMGLAAVGLCIGRRRR